MKRDRISFKNNYLIFFGKKFHLTWIFLFAIFINFLWVSIEKTRDNNKLIKDGFETKAVITDVREVGSKGVVRCNYSFKANNKTYIGRVDDDYYKIGDTIKVLFLEKKPEVNRAKKFLDKIK